MRVHATLHPLWWAILVPSVVAHAVMQLIPPLQEVEIGRGQTGTFVVSVTNIGDEDVPSRFKPYNLDMSEDGTPFIGDTSMERGFATWISLSPLDTVIKAHSTVNLTATVKVPAKAEGGYYALIEGTFVGITIPLEGERANLKRSQIGLESKAVVAVLLTVPSSRARPVIVPDTMLVYPAGTDNAGIAIDRGKQQGWRVVIPIHNEGSVHTKLKGLISFWSEAGTRIESAPLEAGRGYLLPGKTRNFTAQGSRVLGDGYYMVRVSLQTAEGRVMSQSFPFAVAEGNVYPGAATDQLRDLIHAASPGFTLSDPFVKRTVVPGGTTYLAVQMTSIAKDSIRLVPRRTDWNLNAIGTPTLGIGDSLQPRSSTSWIEFVDDELILPPGRNGVFKLKIRAPENAVGEYYAGVIFDRDRARSDLPLEFAAGHTQLLALTTPYGQNYGVEIDSIVVVKERSEERDFSLHRFRFTVRNTGNIHCYLKGTAGLEKEAAAGVYVPVGSPLPFGGSETYLLPNGRRGFELDLPNLDPGKYRIAVGITYKEEAQPVMRYQVVTLN